MSDHNVFDETARIVSDLQTPKSAGMLSGELNSRFASVGGVQFAAGCREVCPDVVDRRACDPGGLSSRLSARRPKVRGGKGRHPC